MIVSRLVYAFTSASAVMFASVPEFENRIFVDALESRAKELGESSLVFVHSSQSVATVNGFVHHRSDDGMRVAGHSGAVLSTEIEVFVSFHVREIGTLPGFENRREGVEMDDISGCSYQEVNTQSGQSLKTE
jgi:hypothetical protein